MWWGERSSPRGRLRRSHHRKPPETATATFGAATIVRVAVIGSGIIGTCTAWFLARAGLDASIFEQFDLDHDRGSSFGDSRIIRRFYDDAYYTRLMERAYPLWTELEAATGRTLVQKTGGLYFAPRGHPRIETAIAALADLHARHELLGERELKTRYRQFAFDDGEVGVVDNDAGILHASRCVRAAADAARAAGARFAFHQRVSGLSSVGGAPIVALESGERLRFDRIVCCAGPWSSKLLAHANLPLRVTRQEYIYLRPTGQVEAFDAGRMPIWIDAPTQWYGFGAHGDIPGCKIACHDFGETVDPDTVRREVDESTVTRIRAYARRRLPSLSDGELTYGKVCLYTVTPDEDFIVDVCPELPHCFVIAGLSGHGFKFGALLGAVAADLVRDRAPQSDVSRFSLSRFQKVGGP